MKFHRRRFSVIAPLVSVLMLTICAAGLAAATRKQYEHAYAAVAAKYGARAPGRNIDRWGYGSSGKRATHAQIAASLAVLRRMLDPPPVAAPAPVEASSAAAPAPETPVAAVTPAPATGGGLADVPGVPAAFAACVAERESSDGAGSSNIYGIIPASGVNVSGDSLAEQKQAFAQMYAADGTGPWSPYDGC